MAYFETKDQAIKTTETLNRSKQYVTKQYKINDENGPREQKKQSKTLSNHQKEDDQWKEHQRRENRGFELHIWAEKCSKCCANNGEKNVMAAIQVT